LGLEKYLVGRKIIDVEIRIPKIFSGYAKSGTVQNPTKQIIGAKIVGLKRIGKGLIIELDNDFVLAIHLKMTGQLVYRDSKTNSSLSSRVGGTTLPSKYSHIIFTLSNNAFLFYNDLRRFGWIKVVRKDELMQMPFFKEMGQEPFKDLNIKGFKEVISRSNLATKVLLMDQKKIGGIGNIYANDALFEAKIDPRRKAKSLSETEIKKFFGAIVKILRKGLEYGGSSDENFVNALGQEGNYQNHALVYGREGEKCRVCETIIRKIKLGGRGTYFCPKCQK